MSPLESFCIRLGPTISEVTVSQCKRQTEEFCLAVLLQTKNSSKHPVYTALPKPQDFMRMQNTTAWPSGFIFPLSLGFDLQHCNSIIGTYFEKCGKVAALAGDYKAVCVDEFCGQSPCGTYSELSRLCTSDGPGVFESWREDPDVVCGGFLIRS